jgi:large subunit ribosomal protein L2
MGIRLYKPTSPGRRAGSVNDYSELTTDRPEKSLCHRIGKSGGRNHSGKTTLRFRGGGSRAIYRLIDFKRSKDGMPAKVTSVEYDPNRGCYISLLEYGDGEKRYILTPLGVTVGDVLESGTTCEPKPGNCMPLASIPTSLEVHNIEMIAGQGGKLVRGAGNSARIMAKEGDWVTLVLPSGEMHGPQGVSGHDRPAQQSGLPEHQHRQSGTQASLRPATARQRQGPEPGRSSPRRRRRPVQRRTPSLLSDRRAR